MGACVSAPEGCVGGRLKNRKNRKRRRVGGLKQKVPSRLSEGSLDRVDRSAPSDRSYANPTFQGFIFLPLFMFLFFLSFSRMVFGISCGITWRAGGVFNYYYIDKFKIFIFGFVFFVWICWWVMLLDIFFCWFCFMVWVIEGVFWIAKSTAFGNYVSLLICYSMNVHLF